MWIPTAYGVRVAGERPELRGRRPTRAASNPTAVRLKVGHALTVTATRLAFFTDALRRGDVRRPLDWMTEVHHPIGKGEAIILDALLYYRRGSVDGAGQPKRRAFVEVDRGTMGPECLAAVLASYACLHSDVPPSGGRATLQKPGVEDGRQRYPIFPRRLFVQDGTGPSVSRTGAALCARPPES